ncbi:MAG TPA: 4Fe-4S binding protein [Verrucomicrobiota bacterium]|nr:4Fe-4S binding protein [Verrucomicrobiota bacterium]HNU50413.1 4Fe-4S binding protein [Verrucomicrobiota bacterium]
MHATRITFPGRFLAACATGALALAEQRFPPPDFESGYQIPITQTPPPRALALQYLDVVLLLVALALAWYFVYRRRSRRGVLWLSLASLLYFGFYREGCICAIGAPQNIALALADPTYAIPFTALAFFVLPLVFSLLMGRVFCAAVCPHGALQDVILIKPVKVPAWLEQGLSIVPYLFLGAGVAVATTGATFLLCRYDPIVPLFRMTGSWPLVAAALGTVALGLFVGRPYCRFLCPYGALLRLGSLVARWRVRITPDYCTQCRLCETSCPFGAIREPAPAAGPPTALDRDRRRLGWFLLGLPLLVFLTGWGGSHLGPPASRLHPTVALAERYLAPAETRPPVATPTPESLALDRANQDPKTLLTEARRIQQRFHRAGWGFGIWAGLVLGFKLISLTLRPMRTDFEPDRAACVACARCFLSCPNERVRLGLLPPDAIPAGNENPRSEAAPR